MGGALQGRRPQREDRLKRRGLRGSEGLDLPRLRCRSRPSRTAPPPCKASSGTRLSANATLILQGDPRFGRCQTMVLETPLPGTCLLLEHGALLHPESLWDYMRLLATVVARSHLLLDARVEAELRLCAGIFATSC